MYFCAFCGTKIKDKEIKTCPSCGCDEIVDYYTYYDETPYEEYEEESEEEEND